MLQVGPRVPKHDMLSSATNLDSYTVSSWIYSNLEILYVKIENSN